MVDEKQVMISVIIPVYNSEKYLHKCIDSVLKQSYQDFELILVNDGSKDSSGDICDEYAEKDERVRVFHQENKGVSSARNLGLKYGIGQWFYFMDADDTINNELFSILKNIDETTEVIQFGFSKIRKGKVVSLNSPVEDKTYSSAEDFINEVTYKTFTLWVHFVKSSLIRDNGIKFTEGQKYAEDLEFTIKAYACAFRIKTNTYLGYNYFVHEESAMSRAYTFENAKLHLSVAQQLFNFCEINNLEIGVFMISRLEYMIKSYFSFALKSKTKSREIIRVFNKFKYDNKDNFINKVLNQGTLSLANRNVTVYLFLMEVKSIIIR